MKLTTAHFITAGLVALLLLAVAGISNADEASGPAGQPGKQGSVQLVDVAKAEKLIAGKHVVILDVRTPGEFAGGHIAGAKNLDFHDKDFQAKLGELDKNKSYLVHCAAGGRSAKAGKLMRQLDFKSVYDLKGGMNAWEQAGKPVVK